MKNKQNNNIQSTTSFNRRRGSINIPRYIELDPEEEYDNNSRINSNSNNGENEDEGYVSSIADDNAFVSNNQVYEDGNNVQQGLHYMNNTNDDVGDDQQHVDYYDLRTNYNPPLEQQQHYDNDDIYLDAPQNEDELDYNLQQQQQYGYSTQYNNGYARARESRRNLNEDEYEEFEDDHRRQLMYQYQQQQLFGAQRNLYIQDNDDDDESFHTASSGDSSESTYRRKRRYTGWLFLLCLFIVILISIIIWQITPSSNDEDIISGRDELNDMQSPPSARYPTKPQLLIPGIPSSAIPSVSYTPTTLSPTTTSPSTNPTKTLIPTSSPTYVPSMSPVNGIITCICDYDTGKLYCYYLILYYYYYYLGVVIFLGVFSFVF